MAEDKMIKRMIFSDGSIIEDCECGYYDKTLWCFLKNLTFNEAFQYFSDPSKFKTIVFEYGYDGLYDRFTYAGFLSIKSIEKREFTIDVCIEGIDISINQERITEEEAS